MLITILVWVTPEANPEMKVYLGSDPRSQGRGQKLLRCYWRAKWNWDSILLGPLSSGHPPEKAESWGIYLPSPSRTGRGISWGINSLAFQPTPNAASHRRFQEMPLAHTGKAHAEGCAHAKISLPTPERPLGQSHELPDFFLRFSSIVFLATHIPERQQLA